MKNTKRALFLSIVSIFLCVAMLAGTTFAWFTDSVESTGNIIKTGSLKVDLVRTPYENGVAGTEETLAHQSAAPLFTYQLWEPGYTQTEGLKLLNRGNLHFKYQLSIVPNGAVSALANVIDVYVVDGAVSGRPTAGKVGTLASVLSAGGVLVSGDTAATTLTDGAVVFNKTITLKMQESAGNEYQNKNLVDGGFSVKLVAYQLTKESDSFDENYDKNSDSDAILVSSIDELEDALENGGEMVLGGDIDFAAGNSSTITVPAGVTATLDLGGHTLTADYMEQAIMSTGELTVKNGNLIVDAPSSSGSGAGILSAQLGGVLTLENVKVETRGGMTQAITVNSGTLNLNEGAEVIVKGSGYQTGVICFGNGDVININGGKIIIDAPADSVTSVGIGSYSNCTVNANSGAITVNDGAQHYGVAEYIPGISFVLNLKSGFAINAEGSGTAIDSSVTVVNN
ncbi:MAG: hypothetical protein IJD67_01900 [Clostridia bacterium]|nr:hypothetical protein [Clostridia bacterium]